MMVRGLDAAVKVDDDIVVAAIRDLAALGVPAGPCGAAGLAALRIACARRSARCAREREHGHTHVLTAPR